MISHSPAPSGRPALRRAGAVVAAAFAVFGLAAAATSPGDHRALAANRSHEQVAAVAACLALRATGLIADCGPALSDLPAADS